MELKVEVDGKGSHRIVVVGGPRIIKGESAGYQGIATLEHGGNLYIAVTEYHLGGPLKPGVVYEAIEDGSRE